MVASRNCFVDNCFHYVAPPVFGGVNKASVREGEVCNYCDTLPSFPAPREVFLSFPILLNRFNPCNIKHCRGWGESDHPLSLCRPGMHSVKIAGMQTCWPRLQFHYRHQGFIYKAVLLGSVDSGSDFHLCVCPLSFSGPKCYSDPELVWIMACSHQGRKL